MQKESTYSSVALTVNYSATLCATVGVQRGYLPHTIHSPPLSCSKYISCCIHRLWTGLHLSHSASHPFSPLHPLSPTGPHSKPCPQQSAPYNDNIQDNATSQNTLRYTTSHFSYPFSTTHVLFSWHKIGCLGRPGPGRVRDQNYR